MAAEEVEGPPKATDYSLAWRGSEEIASYCVEVILTNGGTILWQKYLERKAFLFAHSAATDAVISNLEMCFVSHDKGEVAVNNSWTLEEEPAPGDVDSWARMYLPARKRWGDGSQDDQATALKRAQQARMRQATNRAKSLDRRNLAGRQEGSSRRQQAPPYPIPDDTVIDEEEERLREHKASELQRLKEKEQKAKQAEKVKEQERQRVQALHEQMERCPHTFDTDGNIIWIEEPKVERMPKVQETFPYNVKRDPKRLEDSQGMNLTSSKGFGAGSTSPSATKTAARPRKGGKSGKKKKQPGEEDPEFTDSFAKLQHGQPPVLEVMNVKSGVILHAHGRSKPGPETSNPDKKMSRKEYLAIAEQEEAGHGRGGGGGAALSSGADATSSAPPLSPAAGGAPPAGGSPPPAAGGPGAGGAPPSVAGGGDLPPIQGRVPQSNVAMGVSQSAKNLGAMNPRALQQAASAAEGMPPPPDGKINMDPPAPPPAFRSKRDAIGNLGRPPRYHTPSLGGPYLQTNSAQPPIGATMGHGLLHTGKEKDNYFFPLQMPEPPSPLLRSSSDPSLLGKDRSIMSSFGGGTPKSQSKQLSKSKEDAASTMLLDGAEEDVDPTQGTILPADKKNPAYKSLLHALSV